MRALIILTLLGCSTSVVFAQDKSLPYYEIPEPPATFTAMNVAARMIDGLGFRYYWATEGLRREDLAFKPSKEARSTLETVKHIYGLSKIIVNSTRKTATEFGLPEPELSFNEIRSKTLENLKSASDQLKMSQDAGLEDYKMIFKRDTTRTTFPFWNEINGPISDAIWHVGQVVSFRRSSGNPYNSNASVLTGKVKPSQPSDD